jgi:hypothetical protein
LQSLVIKDRSEKSAIVDIKIQQNDKEATTDNITKSTIKSNKNNTKQNAEQQPSILTSIPRLLM